MIRNTQRTKHNSGARQREVREKGGEGEREKGGGRQGGRETEGQGQRERERETGSQLEELHSESDSLKAFLGPREPRAEASRE